MRISYWSSDVCSSDLWCHSLELSALEPAAQAAISALSSLQHRFPSGQRLLVDNRSSEHPQRPLAAWQVVPYPEAAWQPGRPEPLEPSELRREARWPARSEERRVREEGCRPCRLREWTST